MAIGQLQFAYMKDFQACWEPNVECSMEDVQNYPDIEPTVQRSKTMM
jgi:hypothetical protein